MGSTANLASTTTKATTKMGATEVETMTQGFDHCGGVQAQRYSFLALPHTHRQPLIIPQAQADEETSKGDEDETAASKVDPPQLLLDSLSTTSSNGRVVDVA